MFTIPLKIQELLNSRFCHDLANSLGTLQLSVDHLLSLEKKNMKTQDPVHTKTIDLIHRATKTTLGKHQLYRFAYGTDEALEGFTLKDMSKTIHKFNEETQFVFLPKSAEAISFSGKEAKLFLNLYLLTSEMIPFGGTIEANSDGEKHVFTLHAEYQNNLNENTLIDEEPNSKNIQIHYTKMLHDFFQKKIFIQKQDEKILVTSK